MRSELSGTRPVGRASHRYKNWEIAVYALFLQGGLSKYIHTEDVALKCFELAPDAFSWVRHPEFPDKDIVRVALTDARKAGRGTLVSGRAGQGKRASGTTDGTATTDGWILTEAGATWVASNKEKLEGLVASRQVRFDRQNLLQHIGRLRSHSTFKAFSTDPSTFSPSIGDLAELLRCRPDAPMRVWSQRLEKLRNEARLADQPDVLNFLERCAAFVSSAVPS